MLLAQWAGVTSGHFTAGVACLAKGETGWLVSKIYARKLAVQLCPSCCEFNFGTGATVSCSPHCRAFGTVYEVEDLRTGELYAVKQISKAKLACTEDVEDVRREMQVGMVSWTQ
jgi:hypothetical protein